MTSTQLPFVSIVLPVRNEASFIRRGLGAVLAQDYPPELLEVLIADGMSEDDTRAIIEELSATTTITITILDNPGRIVPTGMNLALQRAKGDVIVRVDGHCEIAASYVRLSIEHLKASGASGVGGPIRTVADGYVGRAIAIAMSSHFGVGGSAFRTGRAEPLEVDSVAFPAYTREAISAAGPLDEELMRNQDDEYNYRLRRLGHKIMLFPDLESKYYGRHSLRRLCRQYFQYGLYKVRVLQKHPAQMKARQFAPPLLAVALLLGVALVPVSKVPLLALAACYGSAVLIAAISTALSRGPKTLPLLPIAFAILHLSYGFGFLIGLVVFGRRWGDREGLRPPSWDFRAPKKPSLHTSLATR